MTHRVLKSHRTKMNIICQKDSNVPSRLLPIRQWLHGNSITWTHDVRLHIAGTNKPKSAQQVKQGAQ